MKYKKIGNNGKVLIDNFMSLFLLQIAGYVLPFITLPYLTRVIGVEKFGEIAFATAIMVYCQTIVDYGFIFSAVRDVSRSKENKVMASDIFSNVMWARFLLVFVSFCLLFVITMLIHKLFEMRLILFVSFFTVIGHAIFPDWMFQAIEKMRYITVMNLFTKILFTILIFVFIKKEADYIYQPILNSLGFCISGLISIVILKRLGFRLNAPKWRTSISLIKSNTDLFINQIVPNLYNSMSTIVLGFTSGSVANGIFDAGNKFNSVASQFISIISRVFFPYLSRNINNHKIYLKIHLGLSCLLSILLFSFAPLIIRLFFTEEFYSAITVLRIMSISLVFLSISNIYGTNYLILIGKEKELRNCTIISSVIGFLLMLPLVYFFSYIGAACTIISARGILAFSILFKSIKYKRNNQINII